MHEEWFNAFLPERDSIVLGITLREYSLGHEILLTRLGSPLCGGGGIDWLESKAQIAQHLCLGVLICSQDFVSGRKLLRSPFFPLLMRFWRWRIWLRSRKPDFWMSELLVFMRYRQAGGWMPEINRPAQYKILKAPWPFRLAAQLMDKFHFSEDEALNFPMARAHCYYVALGELKEEIDPYGAADEALLAKAESLGKEAC